ncbi:hypothetical protein FHL15_006148 [Xylaria flabelliformis]|uniref:Uncharacterized protein n=1 Tax=Xylaria flabelliformis TaxID=2512241 RepID=A0A553HYI5_9PEZI|nr:hypothetical protein FHL15_006148 [Xylaria flabelliformis]
MGDSKIKKKQYRKNLPDLPIVGNQKKWNIIKIVLRALCLLLSITDIAELIAIETGSNALDYWAAVAYPVLAGIILWDLIEFVVIIIRGSPSKGIHPGAHVGVELILWLGSALTVAAQAIKAPWSELGASEWELEEQELLAWVRVTLTQFSFLSLLVFLRFIFFVRACIEVDRRKKDRRLQQLVFAIREQGRDPQDIPLAAFRAAREQNHVGPSTVLRAISHSTRRSTDTPESLTAQQQSRTSAEERDFAYKYNFPIVTVPELLESGIHPEDARNQKVLIGAFPR